MRSRDYQDIIAGVALIAIGGFAGLYVALTLKMGTATRMGPGMFPTALCLMLIGFGVAILIPALFRAGTMPRLNTIPLVTILASIFAFALMVRPFGIVPSVIVMTAIASRADPRFTLVGVIGLAVTLSVLAALIFPIGLGLMIPVVAWPW